MATIMIQNQILIINRLFTKNSEVKKLKSKLYLNWIHFPLLNIEIYFPFLPSKYIYSICLILSIDIIN